MADLSALQPTRWQLMHDLHGVPSYLEWEDTGWPPCEKTYMRYLQAVLKPRPAWFHLFELVGPGPTYAGTHSLRELHALGCQGRLPPDFPLEELEGWLGA